MFTEKADPMVLKKCWEFIGENKNVSKDCDVSKAALSLCSELITSILSSHREFEDAIKAEVEKIEPLQDGPQKDAHIVRFNNLNLSLVLDYEAHKALYELEKIRKNNIY